MRIRWVKVWVDAMATLTERFRDEEGRVDFEALGREEYAFRHALVTGDFSRSERARDLYDATINEITSRSEAGRKGADARWNKKTAAATTREGVDVSTTGCQQFAEPSVNGRKAAVLGSGDRSPSPVCEKEGTFKSPDASDGNAEGVNTNGSTITRNGSRANRTSATSGRTISATEALEQPGAGEVTPDSVSAPSSALPVHAKKAHGEFGNVMLTDDEFAKLHEKLPNVWDLITELDQYIESQGKTKKYKSHYATLLNWSRRKATESKPQQRYKNINDINQENYEKAMREIEAMCAGESV